MRGPNINVMYADVDGNIGWQVVGRIPRRNGFLGDVPLDGQSGKEEWDGFIPFAELPSYYNPPEGYLVSANQNSFPPSTAYTVSGFFAAPQRALQIRDLLTAKPRWSSPEMLGIQTDIYSGILRNLAAAATAAAEKRGTKNPMAMEGAKLLKGWNGQMEMDAAAPMAASLLYQHVKRAIAERASPKDGARYSSFMAAGVVDELVRERPQGWFDDFDLMLSDALSEAMDEGKRMQGRDPAKWRYGRMNEVLLEHPVFGRVALIAPLFDIGPSPMGGSSTTVKQTTRKLGPSMRFTADLANWDNSLMNLTAGQSGHRLSGHYKDEWPAYYAGRGLKMQYSQVAAAATLTLMPR